jgi:hypothetical protein
MWCKDRLIMYGSLRGMTYLFQIKMIVHVDQANFVAYFGISSHFCEVQNLAMWHTQSNHLPHDMIKSIFQTNMVDGLSLVVAKDTYYLFCEECVMASNIIKYFLPILCARKHIL